MFKTSITTGKTKTSTKKTDCSKQKTTDCIITCNPFYLLSKNYIEHHHNGKTKGECKG